MKELIKYLNTLRPDEQASFCSRCGTTIGYIRKASSIGQQLGVNLAINVERESLGVVRCESICPDVDWKYIRGTAVA